MKKLLSRLFVCSSVAGAFIYELTEFGYHPTNKDLRELAFKMKFSTLLGKIITNLYGKSYYDACDRLSYIKLNRKLRITFA